MRLSKRKVKAKIGDLCSKMPIFFYNSIDSTNTRAKELANLGYEGDAVFIARHQTAGRGRMGRHFISDKGKGLYLSILLGKDKSSKTGLAVTTYMAVIASRVLEKHTHIIPKIKWVNDVYANGKKLCGILTEGKTDENSSSLVYTVCGIGINLRRQKFDSEVKNIATTVEDVTGEKADINLLASEIIKEFFSNLHLIGSYDIANEYKERSLLIGKEVKVIKLSATYKATVVNITNNCELVLRLEDGTEEILSTGEVSVSIF